MRSLVTQFLLVIVIILLGALCVRLYVLDDGPAAISIPGLTPAKSASTPATTPVTSDEMRTRLIVREVIREELAALRAELAEAPGTVSPTNTPANTTTPMASAPANPALKAEIDQDLYALIARGEATSGEMYALQGKIARLPASQRNEALAELNRAMNDGRLDAPF